MSMARKCDRCGKLYEEDQVPKIYVDETHVLSKLWCEPENPPSSLYDEQHPYDLCPTCTLDLQSWINGFKYKE